MQARLGHKSGIGELAFLGIAVLFGPVLSSTIEIGKSWVAVGKEYPRVVVRSKYP